ncbi:MAG: Phosphopantetheine attachment site [Firmicutes bacterium]|nr:Phosphopantetheine attachment site [Bacillota bacterium]
MKMDKQQIESALREIIAKRVLGVNPATLDPTQELAMLGADSLAFSWILADMEDAFGFVMRGSDIRKLKTLETAIEYVEQHVGQ